MYRTFQIILGLLFLFSGVAKGLDPIATAHKIDEYLTLMSMDFFTRFDLFLAMGVITTEIVVGVMMILNIFPKASLWISSLMMLVFTPKTLYVAIHHSMEYAGCFGNVVQITPWQSHWKNVFMDVLIIALWFGLPRLKKSVCFSPRAQWWTVIVTLLIAVGFQTVMIFV